MILRIAFTFFTIYLLLVKCSQINQKSFIYTTNPRAIFDNQHLVNACIYLVFISCILRSVPFFLVSAVRTCAVMATVEYFANPWGDSDKWFKFGMYSDIAYYAVSIAVLMIL